MKKTSSIVFVCLLLLSAQCASAQEVVDPLDISNNCWGANPSRSGWNYNSSTVETCCARPPITEPRNYYEILPNGTDRQSYTMTPSGVVRGRTCAARPYERERPTVVHHDTEWCGKGTVNIKNVDQNWWGNSSIDPGWDPSAGHWDHSHSSNLVASNLAVAAGTVTGNTSSGENSFSEVVCSSGLITKHLGDNKTLSLPDTDNYSVCNYLSEEAYGDLNNYIFQDSYDTFKLYITNCYQQADSSVPFSSINAAASGASTHWPEIWSDYLAFLKQVLYLNSDTPWYCEDVTSMMTALQVDEPAKLSALQYILQSGRCPELASALQRYYQGASNGRHQNWLDSVIGKYDTVQPYGIYSWWLDSMVNKDTLAHPYDSAIPSLQQVGLEILLGPQAGVQPSSPITSQALLSAQLLENPMKDEIAISYQMGRTALLTTELRDVLGRSVPIANAKYQLEQPGSHQAAIPAPNLPQGTYYLRITTNAGDAITLKVAKE
jgi:hypothetical protein